MSKWDKYRVDNIEAAIPDKWSKYAVKNEAPQSVEGDSWPALIAKSGLKGITSLVDLVKLGASAGETALNNSINSPGLYGRGNEDIVPLDYTPSKVAQYVPSGQDVRSSLGNMVGANLEPNPQGSLQNIASHAAEFGSPMGLFGVLGKGAKLANGLKGIRAGAGTGAVSGTAQELGVDPLVADIGASVSTPSNLMSAFRSTKKAATEKLPMKMLGLTPNEINLDAAKAARALDVDLPAGVLTDNKLAHLGEQYLGKTPYFGDKIRKKYETTQEQTLKQLEKIYNETGPLKTPEVEDKIFKLYEARKKALPEDASIIPNNTIKALDKIKINSAIHSKEEKELLQAIDTLKNELNPQLESKFGDIKIPPAEYSVDRLIGTKQSLNKIIKWDLDEGVKNQLRNVQRNISEDIAEYGKLNPKWYKTFKEADDLFSKVARREKLESLLKGQGTNQNPGELSYAMLNRVLQDKGKNKLIQKTVPKETYEKLQKLHTLSKAMVQKSRNIPNPSGTAPTWGAAAVIGAAFANPVKSIPLFAAMQGGTKLLTDKKFLDLAIKYAENPSAGKSKLDMMAINKRIKDLTGKSASIFSRELERRMEEDK